MYLPVIVSYCLPRPNIKVMLGSAVAEDNIRPLTKIYLAVESFFSQLHNKLTVLHLSPRSKWYMLARWDIACM